MANQAMQFFLAIVAAVSLLSAGVFADTCPDGSVEDCSGNGHCCPEKWLGDGYGDCGDHKYGCDLRCHETTKVVHVADGRYDPTNADHVNQVAVTFNENDDCAAYTFETGCDGVEGSSKKDDECGVCDGDGGTCACDDGPCDVFLYFSEVTQPVAKVAYKSTQPFAGYQFTVHGVAVTGVQIGNGFLAMEDDGAACSTSTGLCVGFSLSGTPFPAGEGELCELHLGNIEGDHHDPSHVPYIGLKDVKIVTTDAYIHKVSSVEHYAFKLAATTWSVIKPTVNSFVINVETNTDLSAVSFKVNGVQLVGTVSLGGVAIPCAHEGGVMYLCQSTGVTLPAGSFTMDATYVEGVGQGVELSEVGVSTHQAYSIPIVVVMPSSLALPQVQVHISELSFKEAKVRYKSFVPLSGFQFRVRGVTLADATSDVTPFSVSSGVNTGLVIGFSLAGATLPTGNDMAMVTLQFNVRKNGPGGSTMILLDPIFTESGGDDSDYAIVADPVVSPGQISVPDCDENADGWCDSLDYDGDGCVSFEDKDPTTPGGCPLCGDADADGRVTVRDLVRIVSAILMQNGDLSDDQPNNRFSYGDVNHDGRLTVLDIVWIVQSIVQYGSPNIQHPNCVFPTSP